ncbi:MAG: alcaligin biosynthesis protein [Chitinophagaceae bacterium]|nr:MAG: alcaligin biosynthesis protein [Chitinophagaceae bacterium]
MNETTYDLLGIGIGPFNLGLAALTENISGLKCLFLDENNSFSWHAGMLMPWARMQVPFHADLVTLADPCNKYSYLSFLKAKNRLFRFTILEKYFPLRSEYDDYCKWVAIQLKTLCFGFRCERVTYDNNLHIYKVFAWNTYDKQTECFYTKHLVIGIGSVPHVPECARDKMPLPYLFHSSAYLQCKEALPDKGDVTIIGSGQSAGEIFYDLLEQYPHQIKKLRWLTRSTFFPMDYSKFSCEMTSPEYVDYFYSLDSALKEEILSRQAHLYKGINTSLIDAIYDKLYLLSLTHPSLYSDISLNNHCELKEIQPNGSGMSLRFFHREKKQCFELATGAVILATGYEYPFPSFLQSVRERLSFDDEGRLAAQRNYSIDKEGRTIFVQNAELHTHGFNSADLGLGVYRNIIIINTLLAREHYSLGDGNIFQTFDAPAGIPPDMPLKEAIQDTFSRVLIPEG